MWTPCWGQQDQSWGGTEAQVCGSVRAFPWTRAIIRHPFLLKLHLWIPVWCVSLVSTVSELVCCSPLLIKPSPVLLWGALAPVKGPEERQKTLPRPLEAHSLVTDWDHLLSFTTSFSYSLSPLFFLLGFSLWFSEGLRTLVCWCQALDRESSLTQVTSWIEGSRW